MVCMKMRFPAAIFAFAAILIASTTAQGADPQPPPEKKVLHNASVQEIIDQLSGGKKQPRYRGLTIGPSADQANRKPTSGCYTVGKTTKTRGLTVVASPPKPQAGGTDCHPGYISLIHFPYDSAQLESAARLELDKIAAALRSPSLKGDRFVIAGYTDSAGSDAYNLILSARRAASVVRYLSGRGVGAERMIPVGRGERELLDKADPLSAVNRRVEIINASQ